MRDTIKPGMIGSYHGMIQRRHGQEIEVVATGVMGLTALRFPDDYVIGAELHSFTIGERAQLKRAA